MYENPLACFEDVAHFRMEGDASVTFPNQRMRIEHKRGLKDGQSANLVFWCDKEFPADIEITWDFWPVCDTGLCILFFGARGRGNEDIFDPALRPRRGLYQQYHSGDINALHVSYFRRGSGPDDGMNLCNLRKSHGFHLVAQGADPIPHVARAFPPYHLRITKWGGDVRFFINALPIFQFVDNGEYGPRIEGGKIGFRQMTPMVAEYARLRVRELARAPGDGVTV